MAKGVKKTKTHPAATPEMLQYTEDQLAEVFEHRLWTNPHKEQLTKEDVNQGLLLIAQSPEIQKVFIKLRNTLEKEVIKLGKKARDPQIAESIERMSIKHDVFNKILDRAESLWQERSKQKNADG